MKQFLRHHPEVLLITLAIVFLALIIVSFVLGMEQVVYQIDRATDANGNAGGSAMFDISAAQSLDLRGLVK